jgi:phytol kinase
MNQNVLGLIASYGFVFSVIGLSTLLSKLNWLDDEGSRKFIHIGVGHWWLIAIAFFDNAYIASIAPLSFVFINYLSHRINLFKAMERADAQNTLGTVYYAISLLILTFLSFSFNLLYIGGIGILVMTYADGFAAIVGKAIGQHPLINHKTLEGSLTVLVIAFVIAYGFLRFYNLPNALMQAIILAISASLIELISPFGYDNLSLPLGVSALAALMYLVH